MLLLFKLFIAFHMQTEDTPFESLEAPHEHAVWPTARRRERRRTSKGCRRPTDKGLVTRASVPCIGLPFSPWNQVEHGEGRVDADLEVCVISGTFVDWVQALRLKRLERLVVLNPDRHRVIRMCLKWPARKIPTRKARKDALKRRKQSADRAESGLILSSACDFFE